MVCPWSHQVSTIPVSMGKRLKPGKTLYSNVLRNVYGKVGSCEYLFPL